MALMHWNAEEIAARVQAASIEAIDELTAEAATEAQDQHWWTNRTDRLEQETISEPAKASPGGAAGRFGTTRKKGFYGLILEYREPFLRPISDRVFPMLPDRIREKLL